MKRAILILTLAACGEPPAKTTGTIEGRVLLRSSDDPIEPTGLTIELDGPQFESVTVDEEGRYVSPDLASGIYDIRVSLGLWSLEGTARTEVEVTAGNVAIAEDLTLTPAGAVAGRVTIQGGIPATGVRLQLLGTELVAATDASEQFIIRRVPPGNYELIAEKADVGADRRGVNVVALETTEVDLLIVPGGDLADNEHPQFIDEAIQFTANSTPEEAAVLPLLYRTPPGTVRRFDQVALAAAAIDPDGDHVTYEWSASAGRIIDAFSEEALWLPDEYAGNRATITATVRDDHGGIARLSTDIEIVDLFAGSADRQDDLIVHSYRVEGSPWQIDIEGPDGTESLLEIASATDPRPLLCDPYVIARDPTGIVRIDRHSGEVSRLDINLINDDAIHPALLAAPPYLLAITADEPHAVSRIDPATGESFLTVFCVSNCFAMATDEGNVVGLAVDATAGRTLSFGRVEGGEVTDRPLTDLVNNGIALASSTASYVTVSPTNSLHHSVARMAREGERPLAYDGFYRVVIWAAGGDNILITEQEYRSLRHTPFVRLITGAGHVGDYPPDNGERRRWQADRAYKTDGTIALLRRVAAADWPESPDRSRSEIVRARIPEAFQ